MCYFCHLINNRNILTMQNDAPINARIVEFILVLLNNKYATRAEMCKHFNITERTFYRYKNRLLDMGLVVKCEEGDIYRLETNDKLSRQLGELLYFSEEEAYILRAAIDSIDSHSRYKQQLKKKLYALYDSKFIADIAVDSAHRRNFDVLTEAIHSKRQVVLHDYRSAHSNTTTNRRVEPYEIASGLDQVWCFEPESMKVKMFKIARIREVEILSDGWRHEELHETGYVDIFRMHSTQRFPIKLRLTLRAANLLMEEYPLSNEYLTTDSANRYILSTDVCSLEGATRFILGLFDDIEILEGDELKAFVAYKVKMLNR